MFGNKSLPSVIYRYGALEPALNLPLVWEQLRAAHRYRNKLVEIERHRREQAAAVVSAASPDLAALEAQYASLQTKAEAEATRIKAVNKAARKQKATAEDRKALSMIHAEKKKVYAALKVAKDAAYKSVQARAALDQIDAAALTAAKEARANCGTGWGTYLQVENSLNGIRKGPPPKFLSWRGDGKLAVQLQGGMSVEAAEAGDGRLIIETLPTNGKACNVWLRIASDENKQPIWAVVPVIFHRPLPRDAEIKWVYLTARRVACHTQWGVCFVLARESGWRKTDLADSGRVSVDLGWRVVPQGLRVAYWRGDDGEEGEVVISARDVSRWTKADDLRSIRDQRFNAARDSLADWIQGRTVPDWLREITPHLRQWRNAARLAYVALQWRGKRFDGDGNEFLGFPVLEAWRQKDKHLYEFERNNIRKAIAWRDNLYRNLAATLSRRYKTVVVEDADWREIGEKPGAGEPAGNPVAARNRTIAAPGLLRRFLKERFTEYAEAKSQNTTQRCTACGKLMGVDAAPAVELTCPHCNAVVDQDRGACVNLLASGPLT